MTSQKLIYRKQQLKYVLVDWLSAECIWLLFILFRWVVRDGRIFAMDTVLVPAFNFYLPWILFPLGSLCVYYLSGFYLRPQPQHKRISRVVSSTLVCALIISVFSFFIIIIDDKINDYTDYYISLLVLFVLQFTVSLLFRLCVVLADKRHWNKGKNYERTLIIGEEEPSRTIAQKLHNEEQLVFLSLHDVRLLPEKVSSEGIERVIIAVDSDTSKKVLYQLINKIYPLQVEISFTPSAYDILIGAAYVEDLEGAPLVTLTDLSMSDWQICVKRVTDIVISILCLVLLSPVYLCLAVLIKLSSPGPVIYKQERIGLYGRPFFIWKFRTMKNNAEQELPQLSSPNDTRITSIGHWLRKYRLDELPQFWNVLRGDMSIVGPRPERAYYIEQIMQQAPYYCLLYKIRPGLTSWGPIRVGYTDTLEKMIQRLNYDMAYMENMSLLLDMKILFYTIRVILDGKGQ